MKEALKLVDDNTGQSGFVIKSDVSSKDFFWIDESTEIVVLVGRDLTAVSFSLPETIQLWNALGQIISDAMVRDAKTQVCKRLVCKYEGCEKPLAYKGARFCGAACSARYEAGQ